jgi:DNA-binding transcriptional LysR family regulator
MSHPPSPGVANLRRLRRPSLDRTPRGVEPTLYASALLKRGLVVFDELRQGIKEIEFLADPTTGEVRIGCIESLTAAFVPEVIDQFLRKYPRVLVHVVNTQLATQEFRELHERTVDLCWAGSSSPSPMTRSRRRSCSGHDYFVVAGARSLGAPAQDSARRPPR